MSSRSRCSIRIRASRATRRPRSRWSRRSARRDNSRRRNGSVGRREARDEDRGECELNVSLWLKKWRCLPWKVPDLVKSCTALRQSFEGPRQSFEGLRQSFEGLRQSCTGLRQSFEGLRQSCTRLRQSWHLLRQSCALPRPRKWLSFQKKACHPERC